MYFCFSPQSRLPPINFFYRTDATADTLGVAQTGGDQAEDSSAIPQEALDSLIGRKVKRQGVVTDAVPAPVAAPLEGANELADGLLGDSDQIANVRFFSLFVRNSACECAVDFIDRMFWVCAARIRHRVVSIAMDSIPNNE